MYIDIDTTQGHTKVHDVDDLKRFSVRAADQSDPNALSQTLAPLGHFDADNNAWIDIAALRTASGRSDDPGWTTQYDAMVAYAASKGWVNESGTAIRAHLEPPVENPEA
jgi:hypothetical protein